MLKAVRFDLSEHKELVDFIENYRDKKNKPNHSEAIRMLMKKGLESINQPPVQQPQIDLESLKNELLGQVMSQINLSQLVPIQAPVHERVFTPVNNNIPEPVIEEIEEPPIVQKQIPTLQGANPLLANLLSNSQR